MNTYILDSGDVDPTLAEKLIADHIGDGFATLIALEGSQWGKHILDKLGIDSDDEMPSLSGLDVVIGYPDEDLVRTVVTAGASYLDVTNGLVKITVEDEPEISESPDLENVPEPRAPLAKPPRKRKKPEPTPDSDHHKMEHVPIVLTPGPDKFTIVQHKISQEPVSMPDTSLTLSDVPTEDLLRELVTRMLGTCDEATLWGIAKMLREQG